MVKCVCACATLMHVYMCWSCVLGCSCCCCCSCGPAGLGEHVASSPCPVQVVAGPPSARHSSVTGLGRKTAVAGGQAEFVLTFRDAYGNPCSTLAPLLPTQPANAGLNGEADHSSSSSGACAQAQPVVEVSGVLGGGLHSVCCTFVLHMPCCSAV